MTSKENDDIIHTSVSGWYNVALHIHKELKRIGLLLIIAGLIMGIASPSACDEFYNNLLRLNDRTYEISSVNASPVPDCITSNESAGHDPYQPVVRRIGNARSDQLRLTGSGSFCSSASSLNNYNSLLLFTAVTCVAALSYSHIIFIHLKDGHK